jgi:gliding motility-associated-like protein
MVQFGSANVCEGNSIQFNNLSNIPTTDTIQSWIWNFGDSSPLNSNQNPSHLYSINGSYAIKLVVVSNFGCLDSITKISVVNPNPIVSFTASDTIGCEPLCIYFQDHSTIATGINLNSSWTLGDGSTVNNSQIFDHCYTNDSIFAANSFNVNITVTSDSGCISTLSKNNYITVYPAPIANFNIQPEITTIIDPVISITDLSIGTDFWKWNFGDFTISTSVNPFPHTYSDSGSYIITLISSTTFGCIDTTFKTLFIEPDFVFYIPNAFTPNDDGVNDFFSGKGVFVNTYEMSIFDRWGNSIFYSGDINKPWDGKTNHGSEIAEGDVYIYSIKITDLKKEKHIYRGVVTLVR